MLGPRAIFVLVMLGLLLLANYLMVQGYTNYKYDEGFANHILNAANVGKSYEAIGAYDNLVKTPDHGMSVWRGPAPDEPLIGPEVNVGLDNLFIFKNNQCKPECCPSSFSCGSGCVCTTPKQRDYIASRGGNRTNPIDL